MKEVEEERQKSAKQSTDASDRIPINVPDPEEDDFDDLDGMTGTLPLAALCTYSSRYARSILKYQRQQTPKSPKRNRARTRARSS